MSEIDIIRTWKDKAYRASLTAGQQALIPENPAGLIELSDADLLLAGGASETPQHTWHAGSLGCTCGPLPTMGYTCWGFTECGLLCNTVWCTIEYQMGVGDGEMPTC
jgi:mersacidin/lichenicidin family type 2 lantibiotic